MKAPLLVLLAGLAIGGVFAACGNKKPPVEPSDTVEPQDAGPVEAAAPPSLYVRLGGKDGVAAIIESFVGNITADKRVNKLFAKTTGPKLDHFKQMLADQICHEAGGPCPYTGRSMKDAHKGMGITDAQFNAVVEDLTLAFQEKQVSKADMQILLADFGAMKDDVVEKKSKK